MCLNTSQRKPRITDRAITVYKVLKAHSTSPLKEVLVNGKVVKGYAQFVLRPQHYNRYSFIYGIGCLRRIKSISSKHSKVERGFHSYKLKQDALNESIRCGGVLVECSIPKNSQYFTGRHNNTEEGYCSNKIRVVKIL